MEALVAAGQGNAAAKAAAKLGLEDAFPGLQVAADQGLIGRLLTKRKWGIAFLMASKPEQRVCMAQDLCRLLLQPQSLPWKATCITSGNLAGSKASSNQACTAGQGTQMPPGKALPTPCIIGNGGPLLHNPMLHGSSTIGRAPGSEP